MRKKERREKRGTQAATGGSGSLMGDRSSWAGQLARCVRPEASCPASQPVSVARRRCVWGLWAQPVRARALGGASRKRYNRLSTVSPARCRCDSRPLRVSDWLTAILPAAPACQAYLWDTCEILDRYLRETCLCCRLPAYIQVLARYPSDCWTALSAWTR